MAQPAMDFETRQREVGENNDIELFDALKIDMRKLRDDVMVSPFF
jgi:hypothetical protein